MHHRCRAAPRQTDEPALSVKERREQRKALAKEAGLSRRALERQSGIQRPGPRWTPAQKTSSKAAPLGGGRAPTTYSLVPRLGKGPSHCTLKESKPFSEDWCRELEIYHTCRLYSRQKKGVSGHVLTAAKLSRCCLSQSLSWRATFGDTNHFGPLLCSMFRVV